MTDPRVLARQVHHLTETVAVVQAEADAALATMRAVLAHVVPLRVIDDTLRDHELRISAGEAAWHGGPVPKLTLVAQSEMTKGAR